MNFADQRRTFVICFLALGILTTFYELSRYSFYRFGNTTERVNPVKNYSKAPKQNQNYVNVLETPGCIIRNFSRYFETDQKLKLLVQPKEPVNCSNSSQRWTYVNGTAVIVDGISIGRWGSPNNVTCCYKEIKRVEQSPGNSTYMADSYTAISTNCSPLHNGTNEIAAEFIKVECFNISGEPVYRNYHAILNPSKTSVIASKIKRWQTSRTQQLPPNVLILGIDALSRANFRRTMKKTAESLISLGAVEFLGYMKVGDNTFPNVVPLLSGLTVDQLANVCGNWAHQVQDSCPYIWKDFNSSNYLTAHLEDAPSLTAFNFEKIGFLRQQVDFYIRPFMIEAYEQTLYRDCIGPDRVHEKVFRYLKRLIQMASDQHTPLFSFVWLTNVAHQDMNAPAGADQSFSSFLQSIDLENTILVFMSDHGYRYGPFSKTLPGWYEDRLPNLWLYLPPYLRRQKPKWMRNLSLNSKRLTSHFDTYRTLRQILKDVVKFESPESLAQPVGQSLFEEVSPSRTCKDAHIKNEYCPCLRTSSMDRNDGKLAANATEKFTTKT